MFPTFRSLSRLAVLMLGSLLLSLVFAACGGTTSTPAAPAPVPTKAPAPTQAPATNTTPAASSTALQTYPGADFKIGYPGDWKVTPGTNQVQFVNSDGTVGAFVVTPDLGSNTSGDAVAQAAQQQLQQAFKNTQDDGADSSVSIAGENWSQKQFDGDASDGTRNTILILTTLHQPSGGTTKAYFMMFVAPKSSFDQDLTTYFQPMANSFQFS